MSFKGKATLTTFVTTGFLVFTTFSAYAQTTGTPSSNGNSAKVQAYCQKVTSNITQRISTANAGLAKRQDYATKRKANLQTRIQSLQSRGADVTKLQADNQQFGALLDKWITDFQTYISDLQATQSLTCGKAQGKFVAAVKAANAQMKIVRQDNGAIQDFYKNMFASDFQAARQSITGNKTNNSGGSTTK